MFYCNACGVQVVKYSPKWIATAFGLAMTDVVTARHEAVHLSLRGTKQSICHCEERSSPISHEAVHGRRLLRYARNDIRPVTASLLSLRGTKQSNLGTKQSLA